MFHRHCWSSLGWAHVKVFDSFVSSKHYIRMDTQVDVVCDQCGKLKSIRAKGSILDATGAMKWLDAKGIKHPIFVE